MKTHARKSLNKRIAIIAVCFTICFIAIGGRAVYIQILNGPQLSEKAAVEYKKIAVAQGRRGIIYDANHRELASSLDVASIAAFPQQIANKQRAAQQLAQVLKLSRSTMLKKLNTTKNFIWIKRHAKPVEAEVLREKKLSGIEFVVERSRFYPGHYLLGQTLGFTGIDGTGLEGLEFKYNAHLKGKEYNYKILKDALGRGFEAEKKVADNLSGHNLVLTIDRSIQYISENALAEAVRKHKAKSGTAIVMAPDSGALLAIAHYPFFNPNTYRKSSHRIWRNRAITDQFEPGSTMKIFLAAAAIEHGNLTPSSIFYCENGSYRIGRNIVHDTHPHGWLSLQQIVKVSSNIGAVKIVETLGKQTLYQTLKRFGFGSPTGIDCPGEAPGTLPPYRRWTKIDTGAIAFGQGMAVSAIQLAVAASVIANDGNQVKPYIVQAITDVNGRLIESFKPQKGPRVISSQTAQTVRRIMRTVITEGGTGVKAALKGYPVGGKTGTAQKVGPKGNYVKGKYLSSFIGIAPADDPAIVVLVTIDEPQKEHYGGIVAAPAFSKIAQETLHYLNIHPQSNLQRLTAKVIAEANI
jgi:cell division protein FtsI (penicillin-binding protein 3)